MIPCFFSSVAILVFATAVSEDVPMLLLLLLLLACCPDFAAAVAAAAYDVMLFQLACSPCLLWHMQSCCPSLATAYCNAYTWPVDDVTDISPIVCRLLDMDNLENMLGSMFKSDAHNFHRRLGVLRCFRPDNPTGVSFVPAASILPLHSNKCQLMPTPYTSSCQASASAIVLAI